MLAHGADRRSGRIAEIAAELDQTDTVPSIAEV